MSDVVNMKVVGVGGAGNNVVSRMRSSGLDGVTYVNINTDRPTLVASAADERVQIGEKLTHGQGAGSKPEVGRMAAEEDRNNILRVFENTDAVFLTAGMGGGTGTGAIPVVADAAREQGVLTIAVVSTPFKWEGPRKMRTALAGIETLREKVDTLFVIPNENIRKVTDQNVTFANAFSVSDEVLNRAVGGIADLLRSTGFINLDFADLKAILRQSGLAHLGISEASGKGKVDEAAAAAIHSDLTETSVNGARRVIVNMTVSQDLPMEDVTTLMEKIQEAAHPDANIIFGLGYDETLVDALRLIVIATDFAGEEGADGKPAAASNDAAAAAVEKQRSGTPGGEKGVEDEEWDKWLKDLFGKQ
ncbi:MAG: cell division protein FtsZ [Oscillospiraceae bacterium]|nr:cell division protein FtsZ [Oscillospiraceae bacterium]